MNLDKVAVVIRPRDPWQAMDIGVAFARQHFWRLWRLWLAVALPLLTITTSLGMVLPWSGPLWAWLFFWLSLPLCELPILHWLSRALFGEEDTLRKTLVATRENFSLKIFGRLLANRLNPLRILVLPVLTLEQLDGAARKERLAVLAGSGDKILYLGISCFLLEVITSISLLPILYWFVPEELRWLDMEDFIFTPDGWLFLLCYFAAVSISGPFYVCCGFLVYISRRVALEGWDIEIGFKRIAQRLSERKNGNNLKAMALLCLLVPLLSEALPAMALVTPDEARTAITATLEDRAFGETATGYRWELIEKPEPDTDSAWREFWEKLGKQFADFLESIRPVVADSAQFLLLLGTGIVVGLLLWKYGAIRQWFIDAARPKTKPFQAPDILFGMDLRPESLPPDITGGCRELLAQQKVREALSLLYRASLSRLVNLHQLPIESSYTEVRCRDLVTAERPPAEARFFHELTELWMRVAYGHRMIEPQACEQLLELYRSHYGEAR